MLFKEKKMPNTAAGTSNPPLISFKWRGNDKVMKGIPPEFDKELSSLLVAAGYHGIFHILVRGRVHEHVCPVGLHVKAAMNVGVLITWNAGGRSIDTVEMSLTEEVRGVSGDRFFADLRKAKKKLADAEEAEDEVQEVQVDNVVALRPSTETVVEKTPEPESPPTEDAAPARQERFSDNREAVIELFMEEAAKVADGSGWIPFGGAANILSKLGYRAFGYVLGEMVRSGDLMRRGDTWRTTQHRMSDAWMRRFRPLSVSGSTKAISEAVPVSVTVTPSVQVSSSLVEELRSLRAAAKEISVAREELVRVEEALTRNAAERKVLEERQKATQAQIASFEEVQAMLNDLKSFFRE